MREFVRVLDIREVFVVSDDGNGVWSALEILFPFREDEDNSKEFPVIDVRVAFSWGEHLGEVSTRIEITICVLLHKDSSGSEKESIRHDVKGGRNIRDGKNRRCGKDGLEDIKRLLVKRCPNPGDILASEDSERGNNVGIVGNEFVIEVCKAQE